jgi:hypothetical protein
VAAHIQASLVPALNFNVRPCPGPDNINWAALWTTWLQVGGRGRQGCVGMLGLLCRGSSLWLE